MIIFYNHNTTRCPDCYETERALKDMVVAHIIRPIDNNRSKAPVIIEGKKKITGHKAIKHHIKDLQKIMDLWQKFQVDCCYTDSDGKVC